MTEQIQATIRGRIDDGSLHPGARMPSSRDLAEDLGISRSVAVRAYEQLITEGYLRATRGSGTTVASHLPSHTGDGGDRTGTTGIRFDMRPGATSTDFFPARPWLQAYENVGRSIGRTGPQLHPLGVLELRAGLAVYLGRSRGVRATAGEVAVTADFGQTIGGGCWSALRELGIDHVAVENPGTPGQVLLARHAGLRVTGVPVDADGVDVEALERSGARGVLVTPLSQVPAGAVLSLARREALLRWAVDIDGWVIEYDPDGHLWFGSDAPLALQRLCPERVVYVGGTGVLLGRCIRFGWVVAPKAVVDRLVRNPLGGPDPLTQLTFARYLSSGLLDQHVRHVRAELRSRRSALQDAVEEGLTGATMAGAPAGTHAFLQLPDRVDDVRLAAVARTRSLLVYPGTHFRWGGGRPSAPGVVIGYGAVRSSAMRTVVGVLAAAVDD